MQTSQEKPFYEQEKLQRNKKKLQTLREIAQNTKRSFNLYTDNNN